MKNSNLSDRDYTEKRFLYLYKMVKEREPFLNNQAKIVQYGAVLRYFTKFLEVKDCNSVVIFMILCHIDLKLGDIYYEEGLQNQDNSRYFLAARYYNQALLYATNDEDKRRSLWSLREIYYYLGDEDALLQIERSWAEHHSKKDKFAAYMLLSQSAESPQVKAYFLAKALDMVMEQNESFYAKYQDTLYICSQLIALYELLGDKEKARRIKKLRMNTLKLLN